MVDKLYERPIVDQYGTAYGMCYPGTREIMDKINELVDKVNELEERLEHYGRECKSSKVQS